MDVSFLAYTNAKRQWQGEQCIFYNASGEETMRLMGGTNPYFAGFGWFGAMRKHSWRTVLQSSTGPDVTHYLIASGSNTASADIEIRDMQNSVVGRMAPLAGRHEMVRDGIHVARTSFSPSTGTATVNGFSWEKAPRDSIPFEKKGIWLVLRNTEDRELTQERLMGLALMPLMGRIQGHNEMVPVLR